MNNTEKIYEICNRIKPCDWQYIFEDLEFMDRLCYSLIEDTNCNCYKCLLFKIFQFENFNYDRFEYREYVYKHIQQNILPLLYTKITYVMYMDQYEKELNKIYKQCELKIKLLNSLVLYENTTETCGICYENLSRKYVHSDPECKKLTCKSCLVKYIDKDGHSCPYCRNEWS